MLATSYGTRPSQTASRDVKSTANERADFFSDLVRAGEALERAYAADKVNYQILGNLVPHLHAHIQPRFYGDAYPGQPVNGAPEHPVFLTADEYLERISAIRASLQLL
jgi:diadenosine tetraphosphate (Ap4A) HIT family hydrolase